MNRFTRHVQPGDLRGAARLGIRATTDITSLVEALHAEIARIPLITRRPATGRTTGLTGLVYRVVRGVTRDVGVGLDYALGWLAPRLIAQTPSTAARCAAISALNGVIGDHLAATRNPLAIRMSLRRAGSALRLQRDALAGAFPDARSHVVVMVHGLCMNDRQWMRDGHDHGAALARDLDCTPLYLHYNSGLPISLNGRRFARMMERLVEQWPVPIERISVVGHSMGGLVARSASLHAAHEGHPWLRRLDAIVFLGTPHRGAPLERSGHWFETLLAVSPYSAPFARLGKIRSAGITDLRHSAVFGPGSEADQAGAHIPPLPLGVRCLAIGATLGRRTGDLKDRLVGDGIVPLPSALGRGGRGTPALFPRDAQWISYETGHLELLEQPSVYAQIRHWLSA
ncbi:MAG: GPI inositol-deacylase [Burkholderiaceae bacterium]|nr:GPI inositol-deacylase [Burkholderiaceae bacterium]